MSQDLNLVLRITGDGSGLKGELRTASGEVVKFSDQLEGGARRGTRALRDTERQTSALGRSTQALARQVAAMAAAYLSVQGASRLLRTITENTLQQEAALAQLEARVRSTGGAAERSVQQLQAQSAALQGVTTVANEEIERAQATMLTFTRVVGSEFDSAIERVLDLSVAMGTDLQSAALQVGKALNDPIQGVTALQRAGIQLNDGQREQIRLMTEAGNVAGAQQIILAELEQQFGGAARAARNTFGGALQALRNDFDDLLKFTGDMPQLAGQVESISERLRDPEMRAAVEDGIAAALGLIPPAINAGVRALELIVPLLTSVASNADRIGAVVRVLSAVLATRLVVSLGATASAKTMSILLAGQLARGWQAATVAATAKTVAVRGLSAALSMMGGPAGVAILAAGALATLAMRSRAAGVEVDDLEGRVLGLLGRMDELDRREARSTLDALVERINQRTDELNAAREALDELLRDPRWELVNRQPNNPAGRQLQAERERLEQLVMDLPQELAGLRDMAADVAGRIGEIDDRLRGASESAEVFAVANQAIIAPLDQQVEQLRQQVITLRDGEAALIDYQEAQALAKAAQQDLADGTSANVEATQRYFTAIRALTADQQALRQAAEARAAAEREAQSIQQALQQQASALANAYQQLNRQANPLAAETARLNRLLAETRSMSALTEQELQGLGLSTAMLVDFMRLLSDELDDLGSEKLSSDVEALLAWVEQLDMDPLVADIRTLEQALEQATDPANVARLESALARLREELKGSGADVWQMMEQWGQGAAIALRSMLQLADRGSSEYRKMAVAMEVANFAAAIGAILNQGQGDPYSAPARMAAMASAVASLVGGLTFAGFGGFSDTAGRRQASQGTGSVLGDADAKSDSILRATETTASATQQLVGINRGMLRALVNLNNALAGASNRLARGAGGTEFDIDPGFVFSGLPSLLDPLGLVGTLLGGSSKVTDEGIFIVSGTLQQMIDDVMFGAFQEVQSRSWRFGRRRTRTGVADLDEEVIDQFQLVFASLADTVLEGAIALGLSADEVQAAIAAFVVPDLTISLKDLTAEEQQAELEAVFGQIFDGLAGEIAPWVRQFQQVGEGLGETLIRVATGVQVTEEAIRRLGFAAERISPEQFARISEELIGLSGGLEEFIGGVVNFFDKFADDAEKLAVAQDDLERAFSQVGIALPATRDEMWALMQSLDAGTESGREQIAMLLELADVADAYYAALERQGETMERQAAQLQALRDDIASEIARLTMSPLRAEFRSLALSQRDLMARTRELSDSEQDLALVRQQVDLQNLALAERAADRLRHIQEQLWGTVPAAVQDALPDIDRAAARIRDTLIRALESVAEWVRRSAFDDPSLTPVQQFAALQAEFDRLLQVATTGEGQEQADAIAALPGIASQLEALGVQLFGTATAEFAELREGLVSAMQSVLDSVVPPPEPDPVTGSQVAGIAAGIEQVVLTLAEQKMLAAEALEVLGVIRALTGESPLEIAREFGVPLRDAIELLIGELGEGTADTIEQLAHIANTLGVTLGVLAEEIGLNIGELIDHESALSEALRDVIDRLPEGIQDELLDPLMRIWMATSEADANEALAELLQVTDELPAWIRNQLAPFFENIDPVDYLIEQVGLLETMREYERRQADSLDLTVSLLERIGANLQAANQAMDIPAFAAGGWVTGDQVIRAGEAGRELILPNSVSEFFARAGIPVNVAGGSSSDPRIVEKLDELITVERDAKQRLDDIAEGQQEARIVVASGLQDIRSALRERSLEWT